MRQSQQQKLQSCCCDLLLRRIFVGCMHLTSWRCSKSVSMWQTTDIQVDTPFVDKTLSEVSTWTFINLAINHDRSSRASGNNYDVIVTVDTVVCLRVGWRLIVSRIDDTSCLSRPTATSNIFDKARILAASTRRNLFGLDARCRKCLTPRTM